MRGAPVASTSAHQPSFLDFRKVCRRTRFRTRASGKRGGNAGEESEKRRGPFEPALPLLDPHPPLLTHHEARRALDARRRGETRVELSCDFYASGADDAEVSLDGVRATHRGREVFVSWSTMETIADDDRGVYEPANGEDWNEGGFVKVQSFSDDTERAVSLMPSGEKTWPTALIAGFSMHRFGVGVDPKEDTEKKLGAIAPIRKGARALDVCTGLGYTSCMLASRGADVTTIELDRTMTKMCQMNPHSRALFEGNIEQIFGNGADVVKTFEDKTFDVIVTDPPTFALAGELYSAEFYADLKRILKPKGKLYHYIGDPKSASGSGVAAGVVRRLKQVGFGGVEIDYDAHGIIAAHDHIKLRKSKQKPTKPSAGGIDAPRAGKRLKNAGGKRRDRTASSTPDRRGGRRVRFHDDDDDDDDDDWDHAHR